MGPPPLQAAGLGPKKGPGQGGRPRFLGVREEGQQGLQAGPGLCGGSAAGRSPLAGAEEAEAVAEVCPQVQ